MGTVEIESLTSYIQRLAWAYRVNPRVLVAEVIFPHLSDAVLRSASKPPGEL